MNKNIEKEVMKKVITLEKKRTWFWISRFTLAILIGIILSVIFLGMGIVRIKENEILEPALSLIREDKEIIHDYWQETFDLFLTELPDQILLFFGFITTTLILVYIAGKGVGVIRNKLKAIEKFNKDA